MAHGEFTKSQVTAADFERAAARRGHLVTLANPSPRLDYVVIHEGTLRTEAPARQIALALRYVPDRLILAAEALEAYFALLSAEPWSSLEEIAAAVIEDLNNQLLARWVQVTFSARPGPSGRHEAHRVLLEDRQPDWDNPSLLTRLKLL